MNIVKFQKGFRGNKFVVTFVGLQKLNFRCLQQFIVRIVIKKGQFINICTRLGLFKSKFEC